MPLSEFVQGVMAGAVGGLATDKVKSKIDEQLPHTKSGWELFVENFPTEWERLQANVEAMARTQTLVPLVRTVNLFAYPSEETINYFGRQHISLFTSVAFAVRIFVAGAGTYSPNLNPGWNALDLPEGSTLALPQGTAGSQLVILQASDVSLGNAI